MAKQNKARRGDFYLGVQRGFVPGAKIVQKFGRNPQAANGSWEGVLQAAASFFWPQAAAAVRVRAGNAADDGTSSPLGAGAHKVTIQGLDATGAEAEETLTLKGGTASDYSSTTFIRIFRAWVSECGTYGGNNTADIIIEDGTTSPVGTYIQIEAAEGQTQYCGWTVPLGKTAYLLSATVEADAGKAADFRMYTRANILDVTTPFTAKRLRHYWDGVLGTVTLTTDAPYLKLDALTDIWIEAQGGGADTEVTANLELLVLDNETNIG